MPTKTHLNFNDTLNAKFFTQKLEVTEASGNHAEYVQNFIPLQNVIQKHRDHIITNEKYSLRDWRMIHNMQKEK